MLSRIPSLQGEIMPKTLKFNIDNGIMTITLNQPHKKNAIGPQVLTFNCKLMPVA